MAEFDDLLQHDSRAALKAGLAQWRASLTLPQARRLADRAAAVAPALRPFRLAIVHTYTSDLLDPWLRMCCALEGLDLLPYHAPYGLALQEAQSGSALLAHEPDVTLLMLRREDLHPDLAVPIVGLSAEGQATLRRECLERVQEWMRLFRGQKVGQLLLSLLPAPTPLSLGLYDAQSSASESAWWSAFKSDLAEWMRLRCPSSLLIDLDDVMLQVGRSQFFDRRYWYSARFPFAPAAALEFSRRIAAVGAVIDSRPAKVLVLDADNTLWGGIIGEDGIDGIAIGPDYPGNAYLEFQRRILDFQQRGFILALCSKNNPADVEQVLQNHPHQLLRESHFAARRVNWLPKPDNLISLAEELNLGLESFIFVDDSDHECAAVRHRLPEVEVVQVPSRAADVPVCLDRIARLEVLSLTAEDLAKTAMYNQERLRRELIGQAAADGSGSAGYLERLQMRMRISVDPRPHLVRLTQLTRKTNQFNLTTRRYDEERMLSMIESEDWLVLDFSLADVFGDSGIVGLAMWHLTSDGEAELDTMLMSCRVIGRCAEAAFLHASLRLLRARGVRRLVADYFPTPKNELVRNFLSEQGFAATGDGRYRLSLESQPAHAESQFPIIVDVVVGTQVESGAAT